jgi:hypothetical protein
MAELNFIGDRRVEFGFGNVALIHNILTPPMLAGGYSRGIGGASGFAIGAFLESPSDYVPASVVPNATAPG